MALFETIKVMISSRSEVNVFSPQRRLRDVRLSLADHLSGLRWRIGPANAGRDERLFDVWVHETATGLSAGRTTLQISMDEVNKANIIIVLYTGEAGSASKDEELGICHAELQAAIARRREVVYLVKLEPLCETNAEKDWVFRAFVDSLKVFRKSARSEDELKSAAVELLQSAVNDLVIKGSSTFSRSLDRGDALDWQILNLADRRQKMRAALAVAFLGEDAVWDEAAGAAEVTLPNRERLMVRFDAIPAAASQSAARELVGQPFLRDHQLSALMTKKRLDGPLHIVACHRTITESLAIKIIGTPDAIVISSQFGIYMADHLQKTQVVFLAKCADLTSIKTNVRLFYEWLIQSQEIDRVIARAKSRKRILLAVAKEL